MTRGEKLWLPHIRPALLELAREGRAKKASQAAFAELTNRAVAPDGRPV